MLRAPELSDANQIYKWENDPERLAHGRAGLPYSLQLIIDYINSYSETALSSGNVRFVIDIEGKAGGLADLYDIDFSARKAFVAIYVDEESRGKGIGADALGELISFARGHLGLNQLVAVVGAENVPSRKLFLKAGFQDIATLPDWCRGTDGALTDASLLLLKL